MSVDHFCMHVKLILELNKVGKTAAIMLRTRTVWTQCGRHNIYNLQTTATKSSKLH